MICLVMHGNHSYNSPRDIVLPFANYFQSVYKESISFDFQGGSLSLYSIVTVSKITESDVLVASKRLITGLTAGVDGVPSFLVGDCAGVVARPLAYIYNLVLSSSCLPEMWKRAKATPVLKKGDPGMVENYRPISNLCNFAKLLEIILYGSIFPQIRSRLSVNQHGFFDSRSCTINLASLSRVACEALDSRGQLDVVYTDFQKVFDQIDRYVLLSKLERFGLSQGLIGFGGGFRSPSFVVNSGVPQGSNLGPLLFSIFLDDLIDLVSCENLAYADDLKIFSSVESVEDCVRIQRDLQLVQY